MIRPALLATLVLSTACAGKGTGTPYGSTPADTGTLDSANSGCNTDNEDCSARSCGGEGSKMLPGSDCLSCHTSGGGGGEDEGGSFTVAGTVFTDILGSDGAKGVTVRVTDSRGSTIEMTTNGAGNFYSSKRAVPPLSAEVELDGRTKAMVTQPETGACNSCHRCDGPPGGKMYAP